MSRTADAEIRHSTGAGFGSQFMRQRLRKPFLLIVAIGVVGYTVRYFVAQQAISASQQQQAVHQARVQRSFQKIAQLHTPTIDWERVWTQVIAEEERIAREEQGAMQ